MTARGGAGAVLYTPEILALAVELARYPLFESFALIGNAQSRVCGSHVTLGITADEAGRVGAIGARVSACAIGQASAAIFLKAASGRDAADIAAALAETEVWLAGGAQTPSWAGIAVLGSARAFPARHAAILLPWRAALAALSNRAGAD